MIKRASLFCTTINGLQVTIITSNTKRKTKSELKISKIAPSKAVKDENFTNTYCLKIKKKATNKRNDKNIGKRTEAVMLIT